MEQKESKKDSQEYKIKDAGNPGVFFVPEGDGLVWGQCPCWGRTQSGTKIFELLKKYKGYDIKNEKGVVGKNRKIMGNKL